ncbi:hypothetical protein [Aquabacterium sp.]|uniref:hypothetical protein n=1 Tax=Aquabacterium sp. TaxID=1872578 RepID=UPI0025B8B72C|nr:hypothetical protein [Aquabacterium sp.]
MTVNNTLYFWVDGIIIDYHEDALWKPLEEGSLDQLFCIDRRFEAGDAYTYGYYWTDSNGATDNWKNIPFSDFPPEFKLQLLLLGIS